MVFWFDQVTTGWSYSSACVTAFGLQIRWCDLPEQDLDQYLLSNSLCSLSSQFSPFPSALLTVLSPFQSPFFSFCFFLSFSASPFLFSVPLCFSLSHSLSLALSLKHTHTLKLTYTLVAVRASQPSDSMVELVGKGRGEERAATCLDAERPAAAVGS